MKNLCRLLIDVLEYSDSSAGGYSKSFPFNNKKKQVTLPIIKNVLFLNILIAFLKKFKSTFSKVNLNPYLEFSYTNNGLFLIQLC